MCAEECGTVVDCYTDYSTGAYDADNYECTGGYCVWTGCNTTAECQESMMSTDYVCGPSQWTDLDICQLSCVVPADCDTGSAGDAYNADNYDCVDDLCHYTGCNDDAECVDSLGASWECIGG